MYCDCAVCMSSVLHVPCTSELGCVMMRVCVCVQGFYHTGQNNSTLLKPTSTILIYTVEPFHNGYFGPKVFLLEVTIH